MISKNKFEFTACFIVSNLLYFFFTCVHCRCYMCSMLHKGFPYLYPETVETVSENYRIMKKYFKL